MFGLSTLQIRLAGYALAAIAIGLLLWRVQTWHRKAAERDTAVQELTDYRAQVEAQAKRQSAAIAADDASKAALAKQLADAQRTLADIAARPVKSVVIHDKVQPDGTHCPDPRIGPDWLRNWNDTAGAGSPAKPAH